MNRKTVPFKDITKSNLLDFPKLTLEDLEILSTGSCGFVFRRNA
mgnify:CR=1 FL=1